MRQVLLDELMSDDITKLRNWLADNARLSEIEGLYWVDLTEDLLDPGQYEEKSDHPFCFAIEVGDSWAKFEFLVRSRANMRSQHTKYANTAQQRFILDYSNRIVEALNLWT